eukprot:sb/3471084/
MSPRDSCEQADHFPAFLSLKVNGSQAYSFQEPQSSNVKRPPSVPIDITAHCRLSSAYPNALSVTWASNYGQRHCVVVRLVRQHNSQVLLDQLKKHVRNIDHSKVRVMVTMRIYTSQHAVTSHEIHDVIDILSSDDDDDDCAPPPAKKAATTSATTQQTSVIRSNPKPAAESLLSQDPASYAGESTDSNARC